MGSGGSNGGSNNNDSSPGKLFVGGLPTGLTKHELQAYFSQFGKILDCTIKYNPKTGASRGFGFVKFLTEE